MKRLGISVRGWEPVASGIVTNDLYVSPDSILLRCRAVNVLYASTQTIGSAVHVLYSSRDGGNGPTRNCPANREFEARAIYLAEGVVTLDLPTLDAGAYAVDWSAIIALILQWLITRKPAMPNQFDDPNQVMGGPVILI